MELHHRKTTAETTSSRRRNRLIAAAGIVILSAAVGLCCLLLSRGPEPEPPPEQKIRRDFRAAFDPQESTLARLAYLRLRFEGERNISREERHRLIVEELAGSVNRSFADFTRLPPDRKPEQAKRMREDAERTAKYFRSFPPEKRREALSLLADTPGGRAQVDRAIDITTNELSPEDRMMLGPAIETWKKMLEDR